VSLGPNVERALDTLKSLALVNVYVVEREALVGYQCFNVEAERADVLREFLLGFLERDACARLAELGRAADQELHREERLAATCAPAHQRGPSTRQATERDLVEAGDPGRRLGQRGCGLRRRRRCCRRGRVPDWHVVRHVHAVTFVVAERTL